MNIKIKGFTFLHLFRNGISATVIFLDNLKIFQTEKKNVKTKTTNYISCAVSGRSIYTLVSHQRFIMLQMSKQEEKQIRDALNAVEIIYPKQA